MPDGSTKRLGRALRAISATPRVAYFDLPVPLENGTVYLLKPHDVARLRYMEARNRGRVKTAKGPWLEGVVEPVDFIDVCIKQEWRCSICQKPMDPKLKGNDRRAISVEHSPALSVANEHSPRTVSAAHVRCNVNKGHASDTPRAAKIKRVRKDEDRHATRMRAKANLSRDAYKRMKLDEAKLVSRNEFQKKLLGPLSRHPDKAVNGWGKPKDVKFDWKKGRYRKVEAE